MVGEVVFPNTVPPFFPSFVLFAQPPKPDDYEHRLAGIRAHNRWLVDWCGEFPERRAGIGQIFVNDIDDAIEDVRWIKEHGLRGGLLLPNVSPDVSWVKPLYDPAYDRLWAVIEELEVPIHIHGGTGRPRLRALSRVDAALHQRGAVLLAAAAGAVHPGGDLRALPPAALRGHRGGLRLGPAAAVAAGQGAGPHPGHGRHRRDPLRRRARPAPVGHRVLPPERVDGREPAGPGRRRRPLRDRPRPVHVGQRLPPRRGHGPVHPRAPAGPVPRHRPGRAAPAAGRQRGLAVRLRPRRPGPARRPGRPHGRGDRHPAHRAPARAQRGAAELGGEDGCERPGPGRRPGRRACAASRSTGPRSATR